VSVRKISQRTGRALAVAVAVVVAAGAAPSPADAGPAAAGHGDRRDIDVQLLALNDFHGALEPPSGLFLGVPAGGAEYLATQVRRLEEGKRNSLVVSAGDLIGASPLLSALFHDEPTIEAMNEIGLDLNAVGNHEFDEGAAELLRMQRGGCHPVDGCLDGDPFRGAKFDFLAANVVREDTGRTLFAPYSVKRFQGAKVAFVGMTLEGTPSIVTPAGIAGLEFRDEADTVNALVPQLKRRGIESIVVLLHEGAVTTGGLNDCPGVSGPLVDLVARFHPEIDAVISGHTHRTYNCALPNRAGDPVLVTSAGSNGRAISQIDLKIDKRSRDIESAAAENLIVTRDVAPASDITALIAKYDEIAAPLRDRVIGTITDTIDKTPDASGETEAGDLIADAQLDATDDPGFGDAQVALMNPGGVRDPGFVLDAPPGTGGAITYGEAFTVQPFGNSLVTMTLTGAQLYEVLDQQWCGQTAPRILAPSAGFTYTWDESDPACEGDGKVVTGSVAIDGVPVVADQTYRVTVNSFLADGGDNFSVLREGTDRLGGAVDLDALVAYFAAAPGQTLSPPALDRIAVQP
jgi:5'-nucleotidase